VKIWEFGSFPEGPRSPSLFLEKVKMCVTVAYALACLMTAVLVLSYHLDNLSAIKMLSTAYL